MIKYMMILLAMMAFSPTVYALDVEATLAPAAWNYKETMPTTAGYAASTPLHSSASGLAAWFQLRLQQPLFNNWQLGLTGETLTTMGNQHEQWFTPRSSQQNILSIRHHEIRADVLYHWDAFSPAFSLGAWLAWQQDVQSRRDFFVNGLAVAAGTARETIQVSWLGLVAMGHSTDQHFRLRLHVGVPLSVRTVNNAIADTVFNKKQGLRWTINADYRLFDNANGGSTRLTTSYRFRELGNQVQQAALWPKNQWRVFSFGVRQTW